MLRPIALASCILLLVCAPVIGESELEAGPFDPIESLAELDRAIENAGGKPTLLRVRADWNITDVEMDKSFASAGVKQLLDGAVLLQIDVTDNTEEHRELMAKYGVFGPPTILFFDEDGNHIAERDIAGYYPREQLQKRIRIALVNDTD